MHFSITGNRMHASMKVSYRYMTFMSRSLGGPEAQMSQSPTIGAIKIEKRQLDLGLEVPDRWIKRTERVDLAANEG